MKKKSIIEELKNLADKIEYYDKLYYMEDAPSISDAEYDKLRIRNSELERQYPDLIRENSPSKRVGSKITSKFTKVNHKVPMLSLGNTFSKEDVEAFIDKGRGPVSNIIVTNGKYHFNISSITANKHQKILETLVADSPKVIDVDEWETNHFDTSTSWPYDKTFFSLVSETHFVWRCKFLSEKTFKAIYNHHPFILIGDCNSLELLRSYGFKTF